VQAQRALAPCSRAPKAICIKLMQKRFSAMTRTAQIRTFTNVAHRKDGAAPTRAPLNGCLFTTTMSCSVQVGLARQRQMTRVSVAKKLQPATLTSAQQDTFRNLQLLAFDAKTLLVALLMMRLAVPRRAIVRSSNAHPISYTAATQRTCCVKTSIALKQISTFAALRQANATHTTAQIAMCLGKNGTKSIANDGIAQMMTGTHAASLRAHATHINQKPALF
jgi:hypothetical protein